VQVHQELKSKKSVGVHWGTFPLGFEHYCAARKDLHKALDAKGIDRESFITVNHGGYFQVDY
jgi:L-ascorbate metabolism protein UlaG (beta-lactamase superfamily)